MYFGPKRARALMSFRGSREIIDITGVLGNIGAAQRLGDTTLTPMAPSVDFPDSVRGSDAGLIGAMITHNKDTWIRLHPASGLPELLLVDANEPSAEIKNIETTAGRSRILEIPTAARITKSWQRVRGPFRSPFLFPLTARYMYGLECEDACYPIGGYIETNDHDYVEWPFILEAAVYDPGDDGPAGYTFNGCFHTECSVSAQEGPKYISFPLLMLPSVAGGQPDENQRATMGICSTTGNTINNSNMYFHSFTFATRAGACARHAALLLALGGVEFAGDDIPDEKVTDLVWRPYFRVSDGEGNGLIPDQTSFHYRFH